MGKVPLKSVQMSTGTRVYYFDVHKDRKGKHYLAISEIPTDRHPGNKKRGRIFLHSTNLSRFIENLNGVADAIRKGDTDE